MGWEFHQRQEESGNALQEQRSWSTTASDEDKGLPLSPETLERGEHHVQPKTNSSWTKVWEYLQ
jgi:hypothetical protein